MLLRTGLQTVLLMEELDSLQRLIHLVSCDLAAMISEVVVTLTLSSF